MFIWPLSLLKRLNLGVEEVKRKTNEKNVLSSLLELCSLYISLLLQSVCFVAYTCSVVMSLFIFAFFVLSLPKGYSLSLFISLSLSLEARASAALLLGSLCSFLLPDIKGNGVLLHPPQLSEFVSTDSISSGSIWPLSVS